MCIGEVLWDSLPGGLFLGGAPFNVAYHLNALGAKAVIATSVGNDVLGRIITRRMEERGLAVDLLQVDQTAPTGLVHVRLDPHGNAGYEIVAPAAWDFIRMTPALEGATASAGALVFGSLAQRAAVSRKTIQTLISSDLLKVFDVNLRPPFDDRTIIEFGLAHANVVKLNDQEFDLLADWFDFPRDLSPGAAALSHRFGPQTICITRGAHGAAIWHSGSFAEHPGYEVVVKDTVGSGDAFLASLVKGLMEGMADDQVLSQANAHGALVATHHGATPVVDTTGIKAIMSGARFMKSPE